MIKNKFFDDLETRSVDERNNDHLKKLNYLIKTAKNNKNQSAIYLHLREAMLQKVQLHMVMSKFTTWTHHN